MTAGLLQAGGRSLAVDDSGAPDGQAGPAVVMLPGLGGTTSVFQPQAIELAGTCRVVRIDLCGSGRSPVGDGISVERHAADVLAVLDALGVDRAVVVGHSFGTVVARTLAARHPERVAGLVLLTPTRAPAPEVVQQRQHQRAAQLRDGGTAAIVEEVLGDSVGATTASGHPVRMAFVRELVLRQDPEGYARNYQAAAAAADPGPLPDGVPVVLVAGEQDLLGSPAVATALAQTCATARVVIAPGSGHSVPVEAPEAATSAVREVLLAAQARPQ